MTEDLAGIWLKVGNARLTGGDITVQLEGDRADREATWWPVEPTAAGKESTETFRAIVEGLDKKRTILARLVPAGDTLNCSRVRIQHTEPRPL